MGANWYDMSVFYGIIFNTKRVKAISKAIKEGRLRIPDSCTLTLLEDKIHSRTEGENAEDTLERCRGFLGIVRLSVTLEKLDVLKPAFHKALDENRELLRELGVSKLNPALRGGIAEDLDICLGDEEESSGSSSDEDSGEEDSDDEEVSSGDEDSDEEDDSSNSRGDEDSGKKRRVEQSEF